MESTCARQGMNRGDWDFFSVPRKRTEQRAVKNVAKQRDDGGHGPQVDAEYAGSIRGMTINCDANQSPPPNANPFPTGGPARKRSAINFLFGGNVVTQKLISKTGMGTQKVGVIRPNIGRAILGGFVGTPAMTLQICWAQFSAITHMINGSILFPLLYGLTRPTPA